MKKIHYLCRAQRRVRVKAYAGSHDINLNAPSRGILICPTNKPGLRASGSYRCLLKQHDFAGCVYQSRTTRKELYRETVYKQKKCLVKSGKDKQLSICFKTLNYNFENT